MRRIVVSLILMGLAVFARAENQTPLALPQTLYRTTQLSHLNVGDTDPAITVNRDSDHHFAGCGRSGCPTVLFLFLPGSGASASNYTQIARVVAATGLPVLVLNYDNAGSVDRICGGNDPCFDQVRRERFYGKNGSQYVHSVADGIQNRLFKALLKLKWTNFYDESGILWSRIIVAGHSQGAGFAAWISKELEVHRACQFSGTRDRVGDKEGKTPSSRLVVYTEDADCSRKHNCLVADGYTPADPSGFPRYADTWLSACGVQNYRLSCPAYTVPLYRFFHFANTQNDGVNLQWHSFYESIPAPFPQDANSFTDGVPYACLPAATYPGQSLNKLYELYSSYPAYSDQRIYTTSAAKVTALQKEFRTSVAVTYTTLTHPVSGSMPLTSCWEASRAQRYLSLFNCEEVSWAGFSTIEEKLGYAILPTVNPVIEE